MESRKNYVLGATRWFTMPQKDGQLVPAVAVTSKEGNLWVAAYALLLILIFAAIARLVKDAIIAFFPLSASDGASRSKRNSSCSTAVDDGDANRHAILVGYVNTTDPVSIMVLGYSYAYTCTVNVFGDGLWAIEWGTVGLAVMLVVVAVAQLAANAVGGVLVPGNLRLGHVALVSADSIFYPNFADADPEAISQFNGPATVRAAADLDRTKTTLLDKYRFTKRHPTTGAAADQPHFTFGYRYNITGYDFGFQRAPGLLYTVEGECHTNYSWLAPATDPNIDEYYIWDQQNEDTNIRVRFDEEAHTLPFAEFMNNPDENTWFGHTRQFCIVPHTARRLSDQANEKDPWYYTERAARNASGDFQVRRGRPVLVCSQNDTWSHGGHSVPNVFDLGNLTQPDKGGLKLDEFYWNHLLQAVFGFPSVVTVANALSYTALASSVHYSAYRALLNLTDASIQSDLERVVLATLVYSRDVVRNTALVSDLSGGALKNLAVNATTGRVPDSAADFVLPGADVTTLSVRVLIATPVVCAALWAIVAIRGWVLYSVPTSVVRRAPGHDRLDHDDGSDADDDYLRKEAAGGDADGGAQSEGVRARYFHRAVGLSAVQLNRKLDEQLRMGSRWKGWGTFTPFVPDVRVRRRSARLSSSSTLPPPSPNKSPGPSSGFDPVDLGPAEAAEDAEKRLVAPYGRQAGRPQHARSASSPSSYVPAPTPHPPARASYAVAPSSYGPGGGGSGGSSGGGGFGGGSNVLSRARPASEYFPPADSFGPGVVHPWPPNPRPQ